MTAELRIIRLSKAAEVWIVILYMAAELQFIRLLKVKHERKQRLFIITICPTHTDTETTGKFAKGELAVLLLE